MMSREKTVALEALSLVPAESRVRIKYRAEGADEAEAYEGDLLDVRQNRRDEPVFTLRVDGKTKAFNAFVGKLVSFEVLRKGPAPKKAARSAGPVAPRALTTGTIRPAPVVEPTAQEPALPAAITDVRRKERCGTVVFEGLCAGQPVCVSEIGGVWSARTKDGLLARGTLAQLGIDQ